MIDPRADVHPQAQLADDVEVGPWTLIGPDVVIESGCQIASHVVIKGPTHIGPGNRIFQFATVGDECQDKKYKGEATRLEIGANNIIREGCTLHRGTVQDQGVTRIGDHNLLMAYAHVAHDCVVGDHTVLANNVALAGHVHVGDHVILGGFTGVHQFCKVGAHAMIGTGSSILQDVPAYVLANGNTAEPRGVNVEGLKRRGFTPEAIKAIRQAYKTVYRQGLRLEAALDSLKPLADQHPEVQFFIESIQASNRGIIR